ncbi:MAG: SIMPL domain-containing protein [Cyanobacteriota bacterium]|nr:SIMPL domain-containing protein [Cyanobacteriota bacterium]
MAGVPSRLSILPVLLLLVLSSVPARAEVQIRCEGTLLEARGSAEQERPIARLRFSLALEAEQRGSDGALALLQERLAAVRRALHALQVAEFRASSPSTWQRPAEGGRPALSQAHLQVSGTLSPDRLQALIRQVGTLPGVRLAPVTPEAEPASETAKTRSALLAAAYQRALAEAREVAGAIGLTRLRPLEVMVEGGGGPVPLRAMRDAPAPAPPPFDPAELSPPKAFASMLVRFCAR